MIDLYNDILDEAKNGLRLGGEEEGLTDLELLLWFLVRSTPRSVTSREIRKNESPIATNARLFLQNGGDAAAATAGAGAGV
jgi:hypothetical protein